MSFARERERVTPERIAAYNAKLEAQADDAIARALDRHWQSLQTPEEKRKWIELVRSYGFDDLVARYEQT